MRTAITSALLLAAGLGMAQSPLVGFEYWFDQDHINRTYIDTIAPGMMLNETHSPSLAGLPPGIHHIHYRLRDEQGRWSSVMHRTFTKYQPAPHHIVQLRYWSQQAETNPADMVEVSIEPPVQYLNYIDSLLFCNWPDNEQTTVFFQLKDNHGQWSSALTRTLDIDHVEAAPVAPIFIAGPDAVEVGATHTYEVSADPQATGYHWVLSTGWSGGSSGMSIQVTVDAPGALQDSIGVYAYNGCGASDTAWFNVDVITSMNELSDGGPLRVFPNPTTGRFTLRMPQHTRPGELAVLDATGRFVLSQAIADHSGPVIVDLSGHESGVYFVQVRFADGTCAAQRLVKE